MTDYRDNERVKAAREVQVKKAIESALWLAVSSAHPHGNEVQARLQDVMVVLNEAVVAAVSGPARTPEGEGEDRDDATLLAATAPVTSNTGSEIRPPSPTAARPQGTATLDNPVAWMRIHDDGSVLETTPIRATAGAWTRTPHCTVIPLYRASPPSPGVSRDQELLRAARVMIANTCVDDAKDGMGATLEEWNRWCADVDALNSALPSQQETDR